MLLEALAAAGPVDLVVVPVAGPAAPLAWARAFTRSVQVVGPVAEADARAHLDRQLGDPWLRELLTATAPLPAAVRAAPPSLVDGVELPDAVVRAVVGLRVHLAPFTVALARRAGARAVVDADDDDVTLLRALGDPDEAAAVDRVARAWLPECDAVWAAGDTDAAALHARCGVPVRPVPNAVRIPAAPLPQPGAPAGLLFVGNLTYAPNVDAARTLVTEVLPRVRAARPDATLTLVGPYESGAREGLATDPAVRWTGWVPDVLPFYVDAAVVVVPLRDGAGTRIKVLEAAAHRRPIVASPAALAGLDLEPGRSVVLAVDAATTAAAVVDLLDDPDRAAALAAAAREQVAAWSAARVGSVVRRALDSSPASEPLVRRVLWNRLEVDAPAEVRDALDAVLPTAEHGFPAGETFRYAVEADGDDGFRVIEGSDLLGRVPTVVAARDLVHARFHRRVFERASLAGWVRVHGALVDLDGARVLCTGPEGSGKSTLALRLLLDGVSVQGDESVMLSGRDAVAVARPLHCKPGTEAVVPELGAVGADAPVVDGIRILDPARLGRSWTLTVGPVDHVVVLAGGPASDAPTALGPATALDVLPDLVDALFPVTESKPALLGALARALQGVGCHRLARSTPTTMVQALRELG